MEEEKKYKEIELRSEEVQEVMNHISPLGGEMGDNCAVHYSVGFAGRVLDF